MKKTAWLLIAAAAWLLGHLPHPAVDIGKLEPVEAVLISETPAGVRLETDTGAWGEGATLEEAVADLNQADSREVFLDTAEKILIRGDVSAYWQEIWEQFRPAAQICRTAGEIDLSEAAEYLTMHPTSMTLGKLRAGAGQMEFVSITEGRGSLAPSG